MAEQFTNKHLKTLSNLLALALDGQSGESVAALEAVRRRARMDGLTGGALKDMLQQINRASPGLFPEHAPSADLKARDRQYHGVGNAPAELRAAMKDTQRKLVEARFNLDRERREKTHLRDRLAALEKRVSTRPLPTELARFGDFESALRRVSALELQVQRRALDLQLQEKDLTNQRLRQQTATMLHRRRRMRLGWAVLGLAMLIGLGLDASLDQSAGVVQTGCMSGVSTTHHPTPDILCL